MTKRMMKANISEIAFATGVAMLSAIFIHFSSNDSEDDTLL